MFEVHFDFLFQSDVAAYGGLQFLGLAFEGFIVEYADEIVVYELYEAVDEVVGEEGFVGCDAGIVAESCQSIEVEVGWESRLEGIEDEVAGTLQDFFLGVVGFFEDVLKLF